MANDNDHEDDLRPEYYREDFPGGLERGRYTASMAEGSNIVCIDPDLLGALGESGIFGVSGAAIGSPSRCR